MKVAPVLRTARGPALAARIDRVAAGAISQRIATAISDAERPDAEAVALPPVAVTALKSRG